MIDKHTDGHIPAPPPSPRALTPGRSPPPPRRRRRFHPPARRAPPARRPRPPPSLSRRRRRRSRRRRPPRTASARPSPSAAAAALISPVTVSVDASSGRRRRACANPGADVRSRSGRDGRGNCAMSSRISSRPISSSSVSLNSRDLLKLPDRGWNARRVWRAVQSRCRRVLWVQTRGARLLPIPSGAPHAEEARVGLRWSVG